MPSIDEFGRAYLRLTLEIDKHLPGYVDAYYGPPEIRAEAAAAPKKPPAELLDDLARLEAVVPTGDPAREKYLRAVFRAMDCTIRLLGGETFDYLDEVHRLYDISPWPVDTARFEAAHAELDAVLEGEGSLTERLEAFRRQYELPRDKLLPMLEMTCDMTRRRTRQIIELVEGEAVEIGLTQGQPWSAYNWYRGGGRSLIEFNTDLPINALDAVMLFAHEAYPGHHTEHQLKEKYLYHEKGYAECASALLHAPSAVIAEGIATTAPQIILPGREQHDWLVDAILPAAGLPPAIPADLERIARARDMLRSVNCNAAIFLHTGQLNETETLDYIRTYALATEQRARQTLRFITSPLFRAYIFTYTEGHELIARAAPDGRRKLFKRLLTEQVLPSELASMAPPEVPDVRSPRFPR